jgi:hypothetical protein
LDLIAPLQHCPMTQEMRLQRRIGTSSGLYHGGAGDLDGVRAVAKLQRPGSCTRWSSNLTLGEDYGGARTVTPCVNA